MDRMLHLSGRTKGIGLAAVLLFAVWLLPDRAPSVLPTEGEAALAPSAPAAASREIKGLPQAQTTGELQDPFRSNHEGRVPVLPAGKEAPPLQAAAAPPLSPQRGTAGKRPLPPLRLVGILTAGSEVRAIFSRGDSQFSLSPGEARQDICLVSAGAGQAVVDTPAGTQTLQLAD